MNQPRGLLKLLKFDSLIHNLTDYLETRIALVKAEVKDDIMKAMRAAMIFGAIAVLGLFFLLFLSLTAALALNAALDSGFWGFAIITGLYLIILLVLFSLRNSEKVKMMFGDGSLAFLKKQPKKKKQEKDNQKNEKREAEVNESRTTANHEKVAFEQHASASDGQETEIRIEKKENS